MKLLVWILLFMLSSKLILADTVELNCNEIAALAYHEKLKGTKCTLDNIKSDSSTRFVIRTSNSKDYSTQILEVEITNSNLFDMPSEIFTNFPYMKRATANKCGVVDIHKNNFHYGINLNELRLRSNKLTKLPNSILSSSSLLQTLDLSSNQINEIEINAFAGLESLEFLALTDNQLVSLDENVFRHLRNLLSIRLDSNKLQVIEEKLFESSVNLTEIRVDSNEVAIIKGDAFGKLQRLKYLYLGSNRLLSINIQATKLERLWIPYNKLSHLDVNRHLKLLYAPYNQLQSININGNAELLEIKLRQNLIADISNFSSLVKLEVLDISYNPLNSLNISSFARMPELAKLNLEFTNVSAESLTYGTFSHNPNLTQLDLSYNKLGLIDFSIFPTLMQLTHLKIDGNNLTEVSYENFKINFPRLLLVSITDNDWNCTYLSTMIKKLKAMNLIIFVFATQRVYDDTNVDGIRCVKNNSQHINWVKPIVHLDVDEMTTLVYERENRSGFNSELFNANLSKIWNRISDIETSVWQIAFQNAPESQKRVISDDNENVKSEVGFIKIILCLMCSIMVGFALISIVKFARENYSKQKFYYPSDTFRRSTATIQTTMEHVM